MAPFSFSVTRIAGVTQLSVYLHGQLIHEERIDPQPTRTVWNRMITRVRAVQDAHRPHLQPAPVIADPWEED